MVTDLSPFALLLARIHPGEWWIYVLFALLVAVEGPLATLAGAVASSAGYLNPMFVFVAASCGNLTSDILWYSLGYMGKREWLSKYGDRFGFHESLMTQIQKDIHTHVRKILFTAKLTLGLVIPTLVATGLARIPIRRWLATLILAESIWTGSLVLAGYYFGYYLQNFARDIRWLTLGSSTILLILLCIYLLRRRINPRGEQP
jgi:membrane protein DedA with SNARE-associated domain